MKRAGWLLALLLLETGTALAAATPSPALLVLNKADNVLAIVDPASGKVIDDRRVNGVRMEKRDRQPGMWRAEMVTLPLVASVRELQSGEATYPVQHSPFSVLLSNEERQRAGFV